MTDLATKLQSLQELLDAYLPTLVPVRYPEGLAHMMQYHMGWVDASFAPARSPTGKRLRPALCLLVCEAVDGDPRAALPAAGAVELVHNFSLVHDDIQDHSPTRRHRPTVWSLWGMEQAINVGDGLFALAELALLQAESAPDLVVQALRELNEACRLLCEGQYLDLAMEQRTRVGLDEYLSMIERKTGALIACSCSLGALFGGASAEVRSAYAAFGRELGIAFQLQDDLLGVWGEEEETGKPAGDIHQRKKGLPVVLGWETGDPDLQRELEALYRADGPIADERVAKAVRLLEEAGVRDRAEALVRAHYRQALAALDEAGGREEPHRQLQELCHWLLGRTT